MTSQTCVVGEREPKGVICVGCGAQWSGETDLACVLVQVSMRSGH